MVEFAATLLIFMMLLVGVFDVGRAVFNYNGVSQAARDIARETSVHPGSPLGSSAETQAMIDSRGGYTAIDDIDFECTDIDGSAITGNCLPGSWVRVTVTSVYEPVTPILNLWQIDLSSTSSIQIP